MSDTDTIREALSAAERLLGGGRHVEARAALSRLEARAAQAEELREVLTEMRSYFLACIGDADGKEAVAKHLTLRLTAGQVQVLAEAYGLLVAALAETAPANAGSGGRLREAVEAFVAGFSALDHPAERHRKVQRLADALAETALVAQSADADVRAEGS